MFESVVIANYFIEKSLNSGNVILTPMKLLKLVYIAHGWYLGLTGKPLINETVMAWKFGPVVGSVYQQFKRYGGTKIIEPAPVPPSYHLPVHVTRFLDKIWEIYSGFTAVQLSTMTHKPGTPWDKVWNQQGGKDQLAAEISNKIIQEHYSQKVQRNEKSQLKIDG